MPEWDHLDEVDHASARFSSSYHRIDRRSSCWSNKGQTRTKLGCLANELVRADGDGEGRLRLAIIRAVNTDDIIAGIDAGQSQQQTGGVRRMTST